MPNRVACRANSATIVVEPLLRPVDQVHLVDRHGHVAHAQQPGHREVAPGLLDDTVPGVDEDQRELGRGRAGDHVAGVLHVPRGVGQHVGAGGGREVAVGDVDGDALLTLGAQAVGQQREVGGVEPALTADPLDRVELVGQDRLGVVEEAADQGRLPVVHRARRGQPEQVVAALRSALVHGGGHSVVTASAARVAVIRSTPASSGPPWRPRTSGRRPASHRAR